MVHNVAQGRGSGIQHRRRTGDLHGLRRRRHTHLEIQGEALVDLQLNVVLLLLAKSRLFHADVVNAGRELRDNIIPVRSGCRCSFDPGPLICN